MSDSGDVNGAPNPALGEVNGPEPSGARCKNCDADLAGRYCSQCGQSAHVSRSLSEVVHDFAHSFIHFDAKAWRTLPMLVGRPGTLTHDYVHGRRARYLSPAAIFLFSLFLMFFVFSLSEERDASSQALAEQIVRAQTITVRDLVEIVSPQSGGPDELDARVESSLRNIELTIYKMQNAGYKLAFLLVPITLPFLALLFVGRAGVTIFDHTAFLLYSFSFSFLLAITLTLASEFARASLAIAITASAVAVLFALVTPLHLFFHLKGAYALDWRAALWRTIALIVAGGVAVVLYITLITAMGVLG